MKLPTIKTRNCNSILIKLFEIRDQIHYWHLQTTSYAEHKALNKYYDSILDLTDSFIESSQGKYGRISGGATINLTDYQPGISTTYLKSVKEFICFTRESLDPKDTDLQNILDEMLSLTNKTLYLLTLK